jgi:lipoprotein signal peptidase
MEKKNKLEIIGFALMAIGALGWLSNKFYRIEELHSIYGLFDVILPLGLAIWAFGYMKQEALKKKQKESE